MKKRIITLAVAIIMIISFATTSYAYTDEQKTTADALHSLGLFLGIGDSADGTPNYALDSNLDRAQALVILVRMLGKESEALNGNYKHPFTDTKGEWYDKYVGYAYENKLTNGIGNNLFGGKLAATNKMFATFCLRALGYNENGTNPDLTWATALKKANDVGLQAGSDEVDCNRADVVIIFWNALNTEMKSSKKTLAEDLISKKLFTNTQYNDAKALFEESTTSNTLPMDEIDVGTNQGSTTPSNNNSGSNSGTNSDNNTSTTDSQNDDNTDNSNSGNNSSGGYILPMIPG